MTQLKRDQQITVWKQEAKDRGLPGTIARIGTHTVSPERVYCWANDPTSPSGKLMMTGSHKAKDWYTAGG